MSERPPAVVPEENHIVVKPEIPLIKPSSPPVDDLEIEPKQKKYKRKPTKTPIKRRPKTAKKPRIQETP